MKYFITSALRMKHILFLGLILIPFIGATQSRGPQPGEIYFSTQWYYTDSEKYDMIIYSANHGENFSPIYIYQLDTEGMPVGGIYADAEESILYNLNDSGLYRTDDQGLNWQLIDIPYGEIRRYTCGTNPGVLYRYANGEIHWSSNFGETFQKVNDTIFGFLEVGTNENELYVLSIKTYPNYSVNLYYSSNNGITFIKNSIDSLMRGGGIQGNYQKISRGTLNGELYFVSWHDPANYKIYRSVDYGNTFTLQYEQSDTADFFYELYSFTAGRVEGEFYVFKNISWYDGNNTKLTVYYSSDYAKTFTKYEHVFDKDWTGIKNTSLSEQKTEFNCYPNPCHNQTTIILPNMISKEGIRIEIFNSAGQLLDLIKNINSNKIIYYPKDELKGVYYYRIQNKQGIIGTGTMMIL